jgi:hypothetical protein
MARGQFDKSSKWLLQNHGRGILFLGGIRNVRSCRAMQAELVQPSKLPDGLLEVRVRGREKPLYALVEVATYPERRVLEQALGDPTLAYQQLRTLPELLILVLAPKGQYRVPEEYEIESELGLSRLWCGWTTRELWTLSADELLAAGDVGLVPWVPLTSFTGPPEELLRRCRERIEREAPPAVQANLLTVSQVLAQLKFTDPGLLNLLGGRGAMIESPLIREIIAESKQEVIAEFLSARFGTIPRDVTTRLRSVQDPKRLKRLTRLAAQCPDLETFRAELLS